MVNIERLRTALRDRNVSVEQAAEALGVNPVTFYRRINRNGEKFTISEVDKLADLLNLDSDAVNTIFFDKRLA